MKLPVWIYWEGHCPDWIKTCRKTIYAHGGDVNLITPAIFDSIREEDRDIDLSHLYIAHRADFIRAYLLAKFGGLYIDSDCIVMKPLQTLFPILDDYDFFAFVQRQGNISNSFIGARENSVIANNFYQRICGILRSGTPIEWLTIGSEALAKSIKETNTPWFELGAEQVQPICWSRPMEFFKKRTLAEHQEFYNSDSYCYMLSGSMTSGILRENPNLDLLDGDSFFSYLVKKSNEERLKMIASNLTFRENTDDDRWAIPEIIYEDMYRVSTTLANLAPAEMSYIINCGAHIGAFSVMCAEFLENVHIYSFEPQKENFEILQKNIRKYERVNAINVAVSIKEEMIYFTPPEEKHMTGRWHIKKNNSEDAVNLNAINLFDFVRSLDKPIFILKLDLEGHEAQIINNAPKDFYNNIKIIIVETHTTRLQHDVLIEHGFQMLFKPHISTDRQFVYIKRNPQEIFTKIFNNNYWGSAESKSGPGSELGQTQTLINGLNNLLKNLKIQSILDIPCGDFNWMQKVDLHNILYTGADIVEELIEKNKIKYASGNIAFQVLDLINDPLPKNDIIIVRDCLVHFSYVDIFKTIKKIKESGAKYLLTTTFTERETNHDIITGEWWPINLQKPPFNFPEPHLIINEKCTEGNMQYTDKSMAFWKINDLC